MKITYLLSCSCGRKHPVESTQAGQSLRCPCGEDLTIPTMQRLRLLERVEQHDSRTSAASTWSTRKKFVLLGAVFFALGLALSVLVYRARPQLLGVDQLTPLQSLDIWRSYTYRDGIALLPGEIEFERLRERNTRWLTVTLAIAGLGVIVMASSLLVGPPPKARP